MTNFERAKFLARRALVQVDEYDVSNLFAADRLSNSDITDILVTIAGYERDIADRFVVTDEELHY